MSLGIEVTHGDTGNYRVLLSGNLDTETAAQLDARMADVLADEKIRSVRLELNKLVYISSVGLGLLAKLKKAVSRRGGTLLIVGAQPQIAHVFDIVKMLPKETMFATLAEADAYLMAIQKKMLEDQRPVKPIQ